MMPTMWSVFFDADEIPPDVARRIHDGPCMEQLRHELRRIDPSYADVAEASIGGALRRAFDVALIDVLVSAWRHHPSLPAAFRHPDQAHAVLGLGEHEVISTHKPRVDLLSASTLLASLRFDVRLELMVQSATLEIGPCRRVSHVSVGACSGTGHLGFGDCELATFSRPDIPFPERVAIETGPVPDPPAPEPAGGRQRFPGVFKAWHRS